MKKSTFIYKIIRPIVKVLVYLFFRPEVVGKENIPVNGPYVLAGNHTKWLDPVMLIGVAGKNQVHFLAKEEMGYAIEATRVVSSFAVKPVSSNSSRSAACTSVSLASICPFGRLQHWE